MERRGGKAREQGIEADNPRERDGGRGGEIENVE